MDLSTHPFISNIMRSLLHLIINLQFLKILYATINFHQKNKFNELGYYAYAGSVPVVKNSSDFLSELGSHLVGSISKNGKRTIHLS
jgi:hypothetical protein